MMRATHRIGMALLVGGVGLGAALTALADEPLRYPKARTVDVVDDYNGVKVADPYRWLEDPDSPESREWIEAENDLTFRWLEQIPARDRIKARLEKIWDYDKYGLPVKRGDRYFFTKQTGLQNQAVWYVADALDDPGRELINPNDFSKDGTIALSSLAISDDGKLVAYGTSEGGSDWQTFHVRSVDSGKDLPDTIHWVKFSGASWTKDGKGFYYSRYDAPEEGAELQQANYYQKLYYHQLGTSQDEDVLVYHRPDEKEWGFSGDVTDDGRYLVISVWKGTERKNLLFYKDLTKADSPIVELVSKFDAQYSVIDNDGTTWWVETDLDAPRGRVIAIDLKSPARDNWKEVIPQTEDTLQGVSLVGNKFFCNYLHDAYTRIQVCDIEGRPEREVKLPDIGSAGGFGGKRGETETFYTFTSFNRPPTIYRYDIAKAKSTVYRAPQIDINPDDYKVEQVFYRSKDGTRVPMFIVAKKGMKRDGSNPTLLYGYGGFNISLTPSFSLTNLVWLEMGGVYALANLRGGGEYGKEWHDSGRLLHKQNVFDDFIAAGEFLVDNKYTSKDKLSIYGGSNGGLLVGACVNQRPDLFGAAVAAVGVMDMLRFPKFTIGWAWMSDYGDPNEPEHFRNLYSFSPYHNIKPGTDYPAVLIITADHDDRVVPAHSFKYAARLQAAQAGSAPILIRIETRAGHGAGKPTTKIIEEAADRMAFLVRTLKMDENVFARHGDDHGKQGM